MRQLSVCTPRTSLATRSASVPLLLPTSVAWMALIGSDKDWLKKAVAPVS